MLKRLMLIVTMLCTLLMVISPVLAKTSIPASNELWSRDGLTAQVGQLTALIDTTNRLKLKQFLESVRNKANTVLSASVISSEDGTITDQALKYALKLVTDVNKEDSSDLWTNSPFIMYDTPALSPDKRLPDNLPQDGTISDQLSIISAQGEYEAASVVFAPLSNVSSVTFATYELKSDVGTIPASAVDLRVVKTWYQAGTAWQSYFQDTSKSVLVPELLLHDENLVKVDTAQQKNFLRVDYPSGSQYKDISIIPATNFDYYSEPVEDSPTLLPIALKQGESKQMWVTLKVPQGTPAGNYSGKIDITADGVSAGQITLNVRVLPFELPKPKTYYDLNKDFYVMIMHHTNLIDSLEGTKGNVALAEEKSMNEWRNLAEHNVINLPGMSYTSYDKTTFFRQLELMKQAGLSTNPLFNVGFTSNYQAYSFYINYNEAKKVYEANPTDANKLIMDNYYKTWRTMTDKIKSDMSEAIDVVSAAVGHKNLYFDGWDEAWQEMLLFQQEIWQLIHDKGAKVFATGNASHLNLPITEDFIDWVGYPSRERAAKMHALGPDKMITNYANPHTGPENPDLIRQRHGMWLYKANYDATYNYIFFENPTNIWNDFAGEFRAFNLVYPTKTKLIDTIAWEGFREGIDDIRYATKLKQLAAAAIASGKQARVTAANNALNWLEKEDERSINQDLQRLEMIRHILHMLDLEKTQ